MSFVIETDFGTKKGAREALQRIKKNAGPRFRHLMYRYFQQVYFYALQECPVDTGALRASIRLSRSKYSEAGDYSVNKSIQFADDDAPWEYTISAGGQGVINPKHKRVVDYAAAVHDGYVGANGKFHMGDPFLDRAFARGDIDFNIYAEKWYAEIGKMWEDGKLDNVPPLTYFVPTIITSGRP